MFLDHFINIDWGITGCDKIDIWLNLSLKDGELKLILKWLLLFLESVIAT